MVSRKLWAAFALVAAGVGGLAASSGCSYSEASDAKSASAPAKQQPQAIAVTVAPVEIRPIQRRVQIVGTLLGREEVVLAPKVPGRIVRIHHDIGDQVDPGDVLLEIDPTDYQLAVAEAERALVSELAKLGLEEMPSGKFEVESLPAVVRARLVLENAQRKLKRLEELRKTNRGFVTGDEFDQNQTDVRVAQASYRQAIMEVQATLAAAQHRQAILSSARQKLADTKLLAPPQSFGSSESGPAKYVVAERLVSEGEMLQTPAADCFRLVIDNPLKLVATVPERYAAEVKIGQPVEVSVETAEGRTYRGTIARLNPTIDRENRTFQIEAHVENPEHELKAGSFAKGSILTRQDDQGRAVPLEALVTFAGVNKVFVVRDGRAQGVPVQLGVRGQGWVEVQGDLQAGDQVVTSGYTQLADGTPVRLREALGGAAGHAAAPRTAKLEQR